MINWLKSQETITEKQVKSGLRSLVIDGMCSQVMGVFTGGAFLVAFALLLGASNKTIGLLAAIGPATQIL
ncbi:MAG TPA: MFS transporter, partial [Phycisphaerales bacterium]|nr:MFS transporter [Phycisphaerales bacterium]